MLSPAIQEHKNIKNTHSEIKEQESSLLQSLKQ
jgi:hypothetical protein